MLQSCPKCFDHVTKTIERSRKRADTDTDMDMITVSVHVSRVLDFVSQATDMFHLSALAFIMSVFLTNMIDRDPAFCKLHFLIVLTQMTNNFLSISSTTPVKATPWEMFLIWDNYTTKSLENSIHCSTTCMSSHIRY